MAIIRNKELNIGDWAVLTKDFENFSGKITKGTRVKIVDISPRGYGFEAYDEEGAIRCIECGWEGFKPIDHPLEAIVESMPDILPGDILSTSKGQYIVLGSGLCLNSSNKRVYLDDIKNTIRRIARNTISDVIETIWKRAAALPNWEDCH